jgi:hypothetical protein
VHIDDWEQTLAPLVKQIITKASEAELPEKLKARLIWLAEDDVQVANAILNRSQTEQSLNALSLLEKEFSSIDLLLDNAAGKRRVSHELKLPSGSITVRIKKR